MIRAIATCTILMLATCVAANDDFLRALAGKKCPQRSPLDSGRKRCNMDPGVTCGYGEETCCGETFDSIVCECIDRLWGCRATEACRNPSCLQCPDEQPAPGGKCSIPDETKQCAYGEETCCGQTYDSFVCQCFDGYWACFNTDACFVPSCEICTTDVFECEDGSFVSRDPNNNCEFEPCP